MIGPVGVEKLQLRQRGVAPLLGKLRAAALQVVEIHRQRICRKQHAKSRVVQRTKAVEHRNRIRLVCRQREGIAKLQRGKPRLDRIDDIAFDRVQLRARGRTADHVNAGGAHRRRVLLRQQRDALRAGVRALVVLPGQVFHREHDVKGFRQRVVCKIDLRLCKHRKAAGGKQRLVYALHVVTVQDAHAFYAPDAEHAAYIAHQRFCFLRKRRLFFHIDPMHHRRHASLSAAPASARSPMSRR